MAVREHLAKQGVNLDLLEGEPLSELLKPAEVHILVASILEHPARDYYSYTKDATRRQLANKHTVGFLQRCLARLEQIAVFESVTVRSFEMSEAAS